MNAVVSEYKKISTNEIYIIKAINFNDRQEFEVAYKQAFNLYQCQNPHIIAFKGYYIKYRQSQDDGSKGTFCIFMEAMTNSFQAELTNRILQGKEFTKE